MKEGLLLIGYFIWADVFPIINGDPFLFNFQSAAWWLCRGRNHTGKMIGPKEIQKDRDNTAMVWNESDNVGSHHTEERETLQNKAEELYLNAFAFGYIAAGYILGIFGYTEVNKWLVAFCVIVVAIVLMLLGIAVCKHCAKKNFPENIEVHESFSVKALINRGALHR